MFAEGIYLYNKLATPLGIVDLEYCLVFSVDFGLCLLDQLFWFTFGSSFHGWIHWRGFHPDNRAHWHKFPVHHSRHPLSGTDYSQIVTPYLVGVRVYPCSEVSFGQYFAFGFVLDSGILIVFNLLYLLGNGVKI